MSFVSTWATTWLTAPVYATNAVSQAAERANDWGSALFQALGLRDDPVLVGLVAPSRQPAPAPQTEPAMRTWSPDWASEAQAQQQRQYGSDVQSVQAVLGLQPAGSSGVDPIKQPSNLSNTLLYVALGLGGFSALLLVMRNKR
jgi:hypothetical protein